MLDVNALVTERVSLLRPVHPETIYHLRLDDQTPRVHAGADLVKGILTNLLQNAAEAAGPGGSVLVITTCPASDGQVAIEVHDSGPGLSTEASGTLFEPTITFKKHGMGLGLSIAKSHALLSGGDIRLVRGELGGAAFRVTPPRPGSTGDGAGLDVTRTRHIVIVDDEPNIGRSLRLILEHEGYRVTVCESAATFHAERRRGRADLYLLDVRLPDGNGIDLLRAVRQSDETTPVVMISGHGTIRDAVDATRSGAFDFLEEAARARPGPARHEARPRAIGSAAREPAIPRAGRRRAQHDRIEPGLPACRRRGHPGRAVRRQRAPAGRVGHGQGAARRASIARARLRPARS